MRIAATKARDQFSDIVSRAAYGGERVVLTRRGKELAALISIEDLQLLDRLLEEAEDRIDQEEAARALAEPGPSIPWEQVKSELGL